MFHTKTDNIIEAEPEREELDLLEYQTKLTIVLFKTH